MNSKKFAQLQGRNAASEGIDRCDNPYHRDHPLHIEWIIGWYAYLQDIYQDEINEEESESRRIEILRRRYKHGYRGVVKISGKFEPQLWINNRVQRGFGRYESAYEAAVVYDRVAKDVSNGKLKTNKDLGLL